MQDKTFRNLQNYIKLHPKATSAQTLTAARILAFGKKRSMHGLQGKTVKL